MIDSNVLQLKDQLARLPKDERAELAHFLIDTLDDESSQEDEARLHAELHRREAEIRSGAVPVKLAREALEELREKHS